MKNSNYQSNEREVTPAIFVSQVLDLAWANMKARYRKTYAGFLWVIINPLMSYGAQSLVFRIFLKLNIPNYFLFLLGGLLPWIFIMQTLDMSTTIFTRNAALLRSFKINPTVILCSQLLDNLINFLAAFLILLIPITYMSNSYSLGLLFLPVALGILIVGVFGFSWLLATAQIFYKDIPYVVQFMSSILFFLTPVFYPRSYVPANLQWMIEINPFYAMIHPFRLCIHNFELEQFLIIATKGTMFSIGFVLLAFYFWRKKRNEFYLFL
jgi:lipopolysaccharide transport system permease protein